MNTNNWFICKRLARALGAVAILATAPVLGEEASSGSPMSPLREGAYLAPMFSYVHPVSHSELDDGYGGVLAIGYRLNAHAALEGSLAYTPMDGHGHPNSKGAFMHALVFPFSGAGLYGTLGVGAMEMKHYNDRDGSFSLASADGGLGYLLPLAIGRYDFGIRAEALYRYAHREKRLNATNTDLDAPRNFRDAVFNIGLQLPLGLRPEPPPVETPVAVVAPAAICADTQDNDGDGLTDFPGDPGCSAADDNDEVDPPQCSDGKDNDGDGLVDFPADKGCTAADDTDETDPCRTPAAGEKVSLKGCGLGDVIVLRGVNFEFDKSNLTVNAKTILDNVAEELTAYPDIKVEVGGHTDSKGSDEYNQRLSERRAAAVVKYLETKGIAADRMTSAGYGESKPVADNETDEGRELNRRVELKVTAGVAGGNAGVGGASAATPVSADTAAASEAKVEATAGPAADPAPAASEAAPAAESAQTP